MKGSKSTPLKLSTIIIWLTVVVVLLYCVYILPLAFKNHQAVQSETPHIRGIPVNNGQANIIPPLSMQISAAPTLLPLKLPDDVHTVPPAPILPDISLSTDGALFPEPIAISTSNVNTNKAVLVVGGTDGSGTRRVVQILTDLGVTMVSEDPETYDIHADLVKGWPEVVTPVVSATQTLDYTPRKLSTALQIKTKTAVSAILDQVNKDSVKPTSFKLAVGGVLPHPADVNTQSVKYGFKAPVAMTLAPWFAELSPHFKLIHVLRDGRDISFSANQGPVNKFYNAMYRTQGAQWPEQVKSIKLWSDWNSQVHHWANHYTAELEQDTASIANNEKSFGYFAIHSEDLVHPTTAVRYAAIYHLAAFVGSELDSTKLCCLALKESSFMGSHDRTPIKKKGAAAGAAQVSKRYGKWHALLEKNRQLSDTIHREGKEGLSIFGYEPARVLADETMHSRTGQQCSAETHATQCGIVEQKAVVEESQSWAVAGMCTTAPGLDFVGGDIDAVPLTTPDNSECCRKCKSNPACAYFVADPRSQMCYLKSHHLGTKPKNHLISGTMIK